jgi:hypothetical protein
MKKLLLVLIACLYSLSLIAGTIDPRRSDAEYLEYGNQHGCVLPIECVIVLSEDKDSNKETVTQIRYIASCVAISPRWVVTAAHVVKDTHNRYILYKDSKIEVDICAYHSKFDDNKFGSHDIALCHLSKELDLDFYPKLYEDQDEVGKISSQAGYGATGTFDTGAIKNDNKKRAGSNIIQSVNDHLLMCSVHEGKNTSLEFMIANGDSGGGLFIDKRLAGIHSCVLASDKKPNSDYGDESGHTRISVFKSWIEDTISQIETKNE